MAAREDQTAIAAIVESMERMSNLYARHLAALMQIHHATRVMLQDEKDIGIPLAHRESILLLQDTAHDAVEQIAAIVRARVMQKYVDKYEAKEKARAAE